MEYLKHINVNDLQESLKAISNLKTVLKQVLKKESQRGSQIEKFIKSIKKIADLPKVQSEIQLSEFIEKHGLNNIGPCAIVIRYAFREPVDEICSKIVETHGEKFNDTYETQGESIEVKDSQTFNGILKEVKKEVEQGIKDKNLPYNNFMSFVFYDSIFDPAVFKTAEGALI